MTEDQISPKATQASPSARRRLIRGAFAAPAALTLVSGSAYAAVSNGRCISSQVNALTPASPAPIGAADTWLRVPVWRDVGVTPRTFWIKGSDIVSKLGGKGVSNFLPSGNFMRVAVNNSSGVFTVITPPVVGNPVSLSGTAEASRFAILRVDESGNIVGATTQTGLVKNSAIANTCWTSVVSA